MKKILEPGITGTSEITVSEDMLACRVGSGLVEVFSTAMMIAWMEATAVALVQDALPEGMTTVGTRVDVAHVAATPCGMKVTFTAELTAMSANGKGLTFKVSAHDEAGLIGEGVHERVVVNREKFESRTRDRKGSTC
jgi:predicted thioesterase